MVIVSVPSSNPTLRKSGFTESITVGTMRLLVDTLQTMITSWPSEKAIGIEAPSICSFPSYEKYGLTVEMVIVTVNCHAL